MNKEIVEVFSASKVKKGFGYTVYSETVKTRQHGIQNIPRSITFETLTDYLTFLNKGEEYRLMVENYELIKAEYPILDQWLIQNTKAIIANATIWPSLLKVCHWFFNCFEPDKYYIRELPISVHTKFIEENKTILRFILDELVPDIVLLSENLFEKRYHLKYDQPMVRFRILDQGCRGNRTYDDLTVLVDQFERNPIDCQNVFVIENKMNFLTFPQTPCSIAVWGKGFAIESLKTIGWLHEREIYYWSDLDAHGFQMLSQLRSYFPKTHSFLMHKSLLHLFQGYLVRGASTKVQDLIFLDEEEKETFHYLVQQNLRLEQERIPQRLVDEIVRGLVS